MNEIGDEDDNDEPDFRRQISAEHRAWLKSQNPAYLDKWDRLLGQHPDAAIHEAVVRRFFEGAGFQVFANESPNDTHAAPDFCCVANTGEKLYVEAALIETDRAATKSLIEHNSTGGQAYALLTARLSCTSRNKQRQCVGLDAPAIVAVGSFHSHMPLLLGKSKLAFLLTGQGYQLEDGTYTTGGKAFVSDSGEVECREVSALLFFRTGFERPAKYGILHPEPIHAFKPKLLPNVVFGSLCPDESQVIWTFDQEEESWNVMDYENLAASGFTPEEIEALRREKELNEDEV